MSIDPSIDDIGKSECEAVIALFLEHEEIGLRDLAYMCYVLGMKRDSDD